MGSLFLIVCQFCGFSLFLHLNDILFLFNEANYVYFYKFKMFLLVQPIGNYFTKDDECFHIPSTIFGELNRGIFNAVCHVAGNFSVSELFFSFKIQFFLYSKKLLLGQQCRRISGIILIRYFLVLLTATNKSARCGYLLTLKNTLQFSYFFTKLPCR